MFLVLLADISVNVGIVVVVVVVTVVIFSPLRRKTSNIMMKHSRPELHINTDTFIVPRTEGPKRTLSELRVTLSIRPMRATLTLDGHVCTD